LSIGLVDWDRGVLQELTILHSRTKTKNNSQEHTMGETR